MKLPLSMPLEPMEAKSVATLPEGPEWQYEPKWDGFRCLAFRDGKELELQSKAGKPLGRYFPELEKALLALNAKKFVLDGELIIPVDGHLSFDDLLQRIHPAESRIRKLSESHPVQFILFDLLVDDGGHDVTGRPLRERRALLEEFYHRYGVDQPRLALSQAATRIHTAEGWLEKLRGQLDGVVAKRLDQPYLPGARSMLKVKNIRTADCVVGGFRYASKGRVVGSLLLGLYDEAGLLHHVGFTSSMPRVELKELTQKLESTKGTPGFTGQAPGGPSRWSTERSAAWEALRPELVVEVEYDHFTHHRFRHGTHFLRWRPDKDPTQCTMEQVEYESKVPLTKLLLK